MVGYNRLKKEKIYILYKLKWVLVIKRWMICFKDQTVQKWLKLFPKKYVFYDFALSDFKTNYRVYWYLKDVHEKFTNKTVLSI